MNKQELEREMAETFLGLEKEQLTKRELVRKISEKVRELQERVAAEKTDVKAWKATIEAAAEREYGVPCEVDASFSEDGRQINATIRPRVEILTQNFKPLPDPL